MRKINLPAQLENLLFSFLDDRSLCVHENGYTSDEVRLGAGTPQGSCLSPILYLIFVNDLPENLRGDSLSVSQYADDVSLRATDSSLRAAASIIQDGISILEEWCKKWQVMLNPLKSKVVIFTRCPRHKAEGKVVITMFGKVIPVSNQAIFLGVVFDSNSQIGFKSLQSLKSVKNCLRPVKDAKSFTSNEVVQVNNSTDL